MNLSLTFCSEWVLGNREDLVKDIIAELQPDNGEVRIYAIWSLFVAMFDYHILLFYDLEHCSLFV